MDGRTDGRTDGRLTADRQTEGRTADGGTDVRTGGRPAGQCDLSELDPVCLQDELEKLYEDMEALTATDDDWIDDDFGLGDKPAVSPYTVESVNKNAGETRQHTAYSGRHHDNRRINLFILISLCVCAAGGFFC